jgi:hypothetical protein
MCSPTNQQETNSIIKYCVFDFARSVFVKQTKNIQIEDILAAKVSSM